MRYYLAPTIGTGTEADPYRPKVADYQCNWAAVYSTPDETEAIVAVSATEDVFDLIGADADMIFLGDDLDEAMTTEEFQRIAPDGQVMVSG